MYILYLHTILRLYNPLKILLDLLRIIRTYGSCPKFAFVSIPYAKSITENKISKYKSLSIPFNLMNIGI